VRTFSIAPTRSARGPVGCALLAFAGILVAAGRGAAEPEERRTAKLEYQAPRACPDETALARDVGARLGYEAFRPAASTRIRVVITDAGHGFRGRIELFDVQGALSGRRELSEEKDCTEVMRAAAFAVALAIDPFRAQNPVQSASIPTPPTPTAVPQPTATQAAPTAPTTAAPQSPSTSAPIASREPFELVAGLDVRGSVFRIPSVALGGGFFFGIGKHAWSVALEGQAELPLGQTQVDNLAVEASLVSATLAPCLHLAPMRFCLLAELGAFQGSGLGADVPKRDTTLLFSAGARMAAQIFVFKSFFLRPHLDGLAPITRTTLRIGDRSVWTTPPIGLVGGLGVGLAL
jgi:hypothetical protein